MYRGGWLVFDWSKFKNKFPNNPLYNIRFLEKLGATGFSLYVPGANSTLIDTPRCCEFRFKYTRFADLVDNATLPLSDDNTIPLPPNWIMVNIGSNFQFSDYSKVSPAAYLCFNNLQYGIDILYDLGHFKSVIPRSVLDLTFQQTFSVVDDPVMDTYKDFSLVSINNSMSPAVSDYISTLTF